MPERQLYNKMVTGEILAALMTFAFIALGVMVLETEKISFTQGAITKGLIEGAITATVMYSRAIYKSARAFRQIIKKGDHTQS